MKKFIILLFFLMLNAYGLAAVPVALLPFEGDDKSVSDIESRVKQLLGKTSGISVIADKNMDEIMKVQQKAQVMGSSVHDISKLKVAEFLVTGSMSSGRLNLKAVDVNEGTEVYNQTFDVSGESGKRQLAKAVKEMGDKILFHSSSKNADVPSEAKPYMDIINRLVASLGSGDEASYRYMAIYLNGAYIHPDPENKKSVESAKLVLKVMRQELIRSKIYYISMKSESFWMYIDIIAEKTAKKTKYRFGILELDDGSLGVANYNEVK
jgi:hypothetical protein